MPASTAAASPARLAAAAGSANTPHDLPMSSIARPIWSSLTSIIVPPLRLTPRTALCGLRGTATAMESAKVSVPPGRTCPWSASSLNARLMALAPTACTPRILGRRRITPMRSSSQKPLATPATVQPSPTDTATQSGTSQPRASAISKDTVFFPSIITGLMAALRLYQPCALMAFADRVKASA
ncbi:MAG: hypothetical protein BWY85_00880 [Firmicutes bacterium ADurb.Bin506]|nr:MAG: hypothetical protein BWY85_00880 [Firmicutes bacterium ADurb.Bin506]